MSTAPVDPRTRSDEYRAAGYWGEDTLPDVIDRWADDDPDHPYLSDGVGELTYGEFRDQAWRLAAGRSGTAGPDA